MTNPSCSHCGSGVAPDATFCENCGVPVAAPSRPRVNPAPPQIRRTFDTMTSRRDLPYVDEALIGAPSPNQTYLGNRLTYGGIDTDFDPVSNREFIRGMAVRARFFGAAWFLGGLLIFLVFGIAGIYQALSGGTSDDVYGGSTQGGGSTSLLYVWIVLTLLWTIGLWAVFWFTKIPVQLSEWMLTIDGKAHAALPALDHMRAIIDARRPPLDGFTVVRVARNHHEPRLYLQLVDGRYLGFVSSFGYGSDLFIGWTFWLSQSPARWLWLLAIRVFRALTLRASALYDSLGFDTAKAMREMMHSVVRQGVDVATEQTAPAGQGAIGHQVNVFTAPG